MRQRQHEAAKYIVEEFAMSAVAQKKFKPSARHAHLRADAKLPINWSDPRKRVAALTPIDQRPPDNDIHCYRPDGSLYVVVLRSQWKRLREKGELDSYLDKKRK